MFDIETPAPGLLTSVPWYEFERSGLLTDLLSSLDVDRLRPNWSRDVLFHQFASWSPNSSLLTLAGLAKSEDWNYRKATSEKAVPILRNYIVHTFRRAYYQDKVAFSEKDGIPVASFNTGLLTPHYEPIFGFFVKQTRDDLPQP